MGSKRGGAGVTRSSTNSRHRQEPDSFTGSDLWSLMNLLTRLGINPADRQRLTLLPQDEKQTGEDSYFD
jgi:hypothetical protein